MVADTTEQTEPLQFDHDDRRDIYEYVESHGSVGPRGARSALQMDPRPYGHHVAILKRDGVLEEIDGELPSPTTTPSRRSSRPTTSSHHSAGPSGGPDRPCRGHPSRYRRRRVRRRGTVADVVDSEGVLLRHNERSHASSTSPASTTTCPIVRQTSRRDGLGSRR